VPTEVPLQSLCHNMFSASLLRGLHFFRARNLLNSSLQIRLFHSYTGYEHNLYYAIYTYTLCIDWSNANYHSGICRGRLTRRTQYRGFGPVLVGHERKQAHYAPGRLRAALRFKQGGKRVPAIENSSSASHSFAAKIAQREGKSVESDNQAYIAVLQAEIERKKELLKRWANEAETSENSR
jgi:hypothetical protein